MQPDDWSRDDSDCQYSALIFLSKLGRLDLLQQGAETIFVPPAVLRELRSVPDVAVTNVELVLGGWLVERACTQLALLEVVRQSIDPGEVEVIALALELRADDVVLDDLDARRFARRSGLQQHMFSSKRYTDFHCTCLCG